MFEKNSSVQKAEIIIIGNEVTSGLIQETNSRYLGDRLHSAGIGVSRITKVGDDKDEIALAVQEALCRVGIVITTGGLGATHDDITKTALVDLFETELVRDEKVFRHLQAFFKSRGKEVPQALTGQCDVPASADIFYNKKGTAPGLLFHRNDKRLYALPGIPLEMEHLFEKYILPALASSIKTKIRHRILKTTGLTEASLWEMAGPVDRLEEEVTVASLPSHLGVNIRLSTFDEDMNAIENRLDKAEASIREKIDSYVFGRDGDTLEGVVGEHLLKKSLTLGVAESCTGGLISHRITQVEGSSAYFLEGAVTYSNPAKENRLGIDPGLIERHRAVSREVALAMARGIRNASGADIGLSVTGIAGPGGGSEEKPVGLTYIAIDDETGSRCKKIIFLQDRIRNRERSAQAALNLVRLWLMGIPL